MRELWNRLSIRYKITSIIVVIILLVTITIVPVTSRLIKTALLAQQQNNLESVKNLVIKLFEDYQSKVTNYTKLFSNDREIKDSLFYHTELAGEREHPLRAISRLHRSFDVGSLELGDSRGRVVAAAERPGAHDEDRSKDPLIRRALRGEVASGIVLSGNGPVIKAAAPIHYNENQLLGTITSGIALDVSLLARIKKLSNTDLVITDLNGRAITSTLPESGGADGTYLAQTFPLHDPAGGEIVRIVVLQVDRLPRILAKAHMTLLLLLSGIAALSIFILFLILKRVMRPVVRLKEGAERIGKGDFSHRIEVTSHDEIGGLSESFNTMARDLELLRSMEERLAQSERLAAVGRFAAGIAHEINNPIGNVIGLAKLMLRTATDDATREDLETIVNNASRCARITRDLLAYSRQSPPGKEPASLPALIDDAVNAVRRRGDSRKLEVLTEYHAGLPKVMIDSLQISQVLNNILLNAVQAVDSTGMIRISALPDGLAWVRIDISDTGCGIDDKIKDKIFYPFFTTKKDGEGTGLGLAISYGIIQNHGGEIFVESKKGLGSTFSVRLPVGHARG